MINFEILDAPCGNRIPKDKPWTGPVNSIQWKSDRSAQETEKYFCKTPQSLPFEIEKIFLSIWNEPKDYNLIGIPEHKVAFDNFRGGKRNHDFYISSSDGEVTIGVEAKVDESFGVTIEKMKYKSPNSNGPQRTSNLCRDIFGDSNVMNFSEVHYQLLSATAGTLVNAKEKACLVILTFTSSSSFNLKKAQRNYDALALFKRIIDPFKIVGLNDCYTLPGYPGKKLYIREISI